MNPNRLILSYRFPVVTLRVLTATLDATMQSTPPAAARQGDVMSSSREIGEEGQLPLVFASFIMGWPLQCVEAWMTALFYLHAFDTLLNQSLFILPLASNDSM